MVIDLGAVLGLASSTMIVALGAILLLPVKWRDGDWAFGAFLVVWGVELALFNLASLTGRPFLFMAGTALLFVLPLPLQYFADTFRRKMRSVIPWRTGVVGALALGLVGWFVADPDQFVARGDPIAFAGTGAFLLNGLFYATLYFALTSISEGYERPLGRLARVDLRLCLAAFLIYLVYVTGYFLVLFGARVQAQGWFSEAGSYVILFFIGAGVIARTCARLSRPRPGELAQVQLILGVTGVVAAAGMLSAAPVLFGGAPIRLGGLFRIFAALLLAYGILKHQVFGLDLQLKKLAPKLVPVSAFLAVGTVSGALFQTTVQMTLAGVPFFFVGGVAMGATASIASLPFRHGVSGRVLPRVADDTTYKRSHALEIYQASLAQSMASGAGADDPILLILRKKLGLTPQDHDALLYVVQTEAGASVTRSPAPPRGRGDGRYRRERLLKQGPLVKVWVARDGVLDRTVVLKEFQRSDDPTPYAEARASSGLDNPHVVTVFDLFEEESRPVLVLEYVDGGSLQDRLDASPEAPFPQAEALQVCDDVLRGLVALHARGVVHLDLKPANVLLTAKGRAKITDFGIAERAVGQAAPDLETGTLVASTGTGAGTPFYMSPEQAEGRGTDAASDLYAVGAILVRLVTGRHYLALAGLTEFAVRRAVVEQAPDLSHVPEPARALAERALAKDPRARYASAAEMLAAVEAARADLARAPAVDATPVG